MEIGEFIVENGGYTFDVNYPLIHKIKNDDELNYLIEKYQNNISDLEIKDSIESSIFLYFQKEIRKIAFKINFYNEVDINDLIQAGSMSVVNSIKAFNPNAGAKFSTFVYRRIEADIKRYYRTIVDQIRKPVNSYTDIANIYSVISDYEREYDGAPSNKYIAEKTKYSEKRVKELREAFLPTIALDGTIDENEEVTIMDTIADERSHFAEENYSDVIKNILPGISETERKLMFFVIGCTKYGEKIGKGVGKNITACANYLGCSWREAADIYRNIENKIKTAYVERYAA